MQLVGAAGVDREVGHGFVTYPGAYLGGADVVFRPTADGAEDYLSFAAAPRDPRVEYDVELPPDARGLRLVENTLEILEKNGTPRVRAARPRVVGSDGQITDATLTVTGCDVDTNPAAPWGRAVTPPGASTCRVAVTWDPSTVTYPALMDPSWSATANMTTARSLHTATLLSGSGGNNDILVIGGDTTGTCELFNPTTLTWATTASAGVTTGHTATLLQNGTGVLVTGGRYSQYFSGGGTHGIPAYHGYAAEAYSSYEVYSTSAGTWSTGTSAGGCTAGHMCSERAFHAAALLSDGRVLVAGGISYSVEIVNNVPTAFPSSLASSEIYSPSMNFFTNVTGPTGVMSSARDKFTLTLLTNGKVFAADGEDYVTSTPTTLSSFDQFTPAMAPATGAWASVANSGATDAREGSVAFLTASGNIALFGGSSATNNDLINASANPPLTKYTSPAAATFSAIALTSSGRLLQIGGATTAGVSGLVESYPFTTSNDGTALTSGTSLPTLLTPRQSHTATAFGDSTGRILVAGGTISSGATTNSAEIYSPCGSPGAACTLASPNPCMSAPTCNASQQCVQTTPLTGSSCTLTSPNACMSAPTCTSSGTCVQATPLATGTACNDGNPCTQSDACSAGSCVGGPPVQCTAADRCHVPGTCSPSTGCSTPPAAAGTSCDDGNACNGLELCSASGTCLPGVSTPTGVVSPDGCTTTSCNSALGVQTVAAPGAPAACSASQSLAGSGIDGTVPRNLSDGVAFLYSGSPPQITGFTANVGQNGQPPILKPNQVAVIRGQVFQSDGKTAIAGVTASIVKHPEYGVATTLADGWFSLVVNGGPDYVVQYQPPAGSTLLPVQRTAHTRWQDYTVLPAVDLILQESAFPASITISPTAYVSVQGNQKTTDAAHRPTLLFPPNIHAKTPSGDYSSPFGVNITEYSDGPNGLAQMPGDLPPASGFTYAAEFALTGFQPGEVSFVDGLENPDPVIFYMESFIMQGIFGVGSSVPTGHYDTSAGQWVANEPSASAGSTNGSGALVQFNGCTGGVASVSTGGALTLPQGELVALCNLAYPYATGTFLWRVPVNHFSDWDMNMGYGPVAGAVTPPVGMPLADTPPDQQCQKAGSIIECEGQVLAEELPIVGTPYSLRYQSDRQRGRLPTLQIPITGSTVMPPEVLEVGVEIIVAGKTYNYVLPPNITAEQSVTWVWDRLDAYGRYVQGAWNAHVGVGYVYPTDGNYADSPVFGYNGGNSISLSNGRNERLLTIWTFHDVQIGGIDETPKGFGGWTVSAAHTYDSLATVLYKGDGSVRSANTLPDTISTLHAGIAGETCYGDVQGMTVGLDGTVYYSYTNLIYAVDRSGHASWFAGSNCDGGAPNPVPTPVATAIITGGAMATGPDGALYIADTNNDPYCVVQQISNGMVTTVAGNGTCATTCDETETPTAPPVLATSIALGHLQSVAVAPDGSMYFEETCTNGATTGTRIRRVAPNHTISTFAGAVTQLRPTGDGSAALSANIGWPGCMAVGADGTLYVSDDVHLAGYEEWGGSVRHIRADGIIETVAGGATGHVLLFGDGLPATSAELASNCVQVARDGTLFISDLSNTQGDSRSLIRQVDGSGTITTLAGVNNGLGTTQEHVVGRRRPGGGGRVSPDVTRIALGPDGSIYAVDNPGDGPGASIRKITRALAGVYPSGALGPTIADQGGGEAYIFNPEGQIQQTIELVRNSTLRSFSYDPSTQLLTSISDRFCVHPERRRSIAAPRGRSR